MKRQTIIKYNNIILRDLSYDDIEIIRTWRNDSNNNKYLKNIGEVSIKQQEQWYKRYLDSNDEIIFVIEENKMLNRTVGSLALYNILSNTAEFGHMLIGDKDAHGKGIGKKSLIMLLYYAFKILKMEKVYCYVNKDNMSALINYVNIGFYIIGARKSNSLIGGVDFELKIDSERFKNINHNLEKDIIIDSNVG